MTSKKIAVIDDDEFFLNAIVDILEEEGFSVSSYTNGELAKDDLINQSFDLILTDIRMPKVHGIELLHYVKRNHLKAPVVFMTGFSNVLEIDEAIKIGAKAFLSKPFDPDELFDTIENLLYGKKAQTPVNEDSKPTELVIDYFSIKTEYFTNGSHINFPIYIKVSEKYIKVAHTGEDLSEERIQNLLKRGISHFYIKREHVPHYQEFLKEYVELTSSQASAQDIDKALTLTKFNSFLFDNHVWNKLNTESFQMVKENIIRCIDFVSQNTKDGQKLFKLINHRDDIFSESMNIFILGLIVMPELLIKDEKLIRNFSLAAIFHDIGFSHYPTYLFNKPVNKMSDEEFASYQSHPKKSVQILSRFFDPKSPFIKTIADHHELMDASGFPSKKSKKEISSSALLLGLIDLLFRRTDKAFYQEAIEIKNLYSQCYPTAHLDALVSVTKNLFGE